MLSRNETPTQLWPTPLAAIFNAAPPRESYRVNYIILTRGLGDQPPVTRGVFWGQITAFQRRDTFLGQTPVALCLGRVASK